MHFPPKEVIFNEKTNEIKEKKLRLQKSVNNKLNQNPPEWNNIVSNGKWKKPNFINKFLAYNNQKKVSIHVVSKD